MALTFPPELQITDVKATSVQAKQDGQGKVVVDQPFTLGANGEVTVIVGAGP